MKIFAKAGPARLIATLLGATLLVGLVGLGGCDQNVKFTIFRAKLDKVGAGMSQYTQQGSGGTQCVVDEDRVDVGMLPLYTRRDKEKGRTVKELLLPGSLLAGCVLRIEENLPDTVKDCRVGTDDINFRLTDVHLVSTADKSVCCGIGCEDSATMTAVEDCAATYGDGWSCNPNRSVCEHDFEINALSFEFDPVGDIADDRLVALVMDNSGTLIGDDDGVPDPSKATDRTSDGRQDFRIGAVKDFAGTLSSADTLGIYTYDTAGSTGVVNQIKVGACKAESGWVNADDACVETTVKGLSLLVATGSGSPVWDAVIKAVEELRVQKNAGGGNPMVILFADGPPDSTDKALPDAINAAVNNNDNPDDDIPVFIVHLDNINVMEPPTGRFEPYDTLACATGGAYFYVDSADHLTDVYTNHLPFLTQGHYTLQVGYTKLKLGDEFPANSCYAIKTQIGLTIEGEERTLALQKTSSLTGGGAKFDSRIHVCKQ